MATTTLTSFSLPKTESKELCSICKEQPYDLICTCGDKFDFTCIHQHVEIIGLEFNEQYQQVSENLTQINSLTDKENANLDTARTAIENWKQKRIQDINDIADKALDDVEQRGNFFEEVPGFGETFNRLSMELHRIVHETLNTVIKLNQRIKDKNENYQNLPPLVNDEGGLDALMQSKLHPSVVDMHESNSLPTASSSLSFRRNQQNSTRIETEPVVVSPAASSSSFYRNQQSSTRIEPEPVPFSPAASSSSLYRNQQNPTRIEAEPVPFSPIASSSSFNRNHQDFTRTEEEPIIPPPAIERTEPREELRNTDPPVALTNTVQTNDTITEGTNHDEFEAGFTRRIQRDDPILIPANNDKFMGTVCCHNDQLVYNDFDRQTQSFELIFMGDIHNTRTKQIIDWNPPDPTGNVDNDDFVQDIIYSNKLSCFLLLNRSRLLQFSERNTELDEFHTFNDRTMKRLACNDKYIYLTATHNNAGNRGDEVILMNYNKEEQVSKTLREIFPSRLTRGSPQLVGEISDLNVDANGQVIIGYRLERRHEVGVCLFNVTNDGREWSSVKQLLLNECWHSGLSYTPRIEWSEKLNLFILIEHMTGHLIMIDGEGQVQGECRFMHAENRREAPINLAISNNDWLCVRYESSIGVHKLTS